MVETTFEASGQFELRLSDTNQVVKQFTAPGVEGYLLGRSDNTSSYVPDIDLAAYDALKRGISRRHAALVRFRDGVYIVDLASVNGTFLNDQRLQPEKPYPFQPDIMLRLGSLNLVFIKIK
jgi:pSer/pThr/pTyr-binding forkhead associated (FHA) protein